MKIIADDQIPLLDELFPSPQILIKKPGTQINHTDLFDADILWVRTVTAINPALLSNTPVKFVGTATAGFDHLHTDWLEQQQIGWGYAPGANAIAVAEYVLCCIAALRSQGKLRGTSLRAGIIGVGQAGTIVAQCLAKIGFEVVLNDPPREQRDQNFYSTPLAEWQNLDLICIHAALTHDGQFPSYHLLDDQFLQRQKSGCVLLNAARGAIIDTNVLLRHSHLITCLDVWEHEPEINLQLLSRASIATPHIAGYSVDAKRRASLLLYQQTQKFFGDLLPPLSTMSTLVKGADTSVNFSALNQQWEARALTIYNPLQYTDLMRRSLLNTSNVGQEFLRLRQSYRWRGNLL